MSSGTIGANSLRRTLMRAYDVEVLIEADDVKIFERVKRICREAFVERIDFLDSPVKVSKPTYRFLTSTDGSVTYDLDGVLRGTFSEGVGFDRFLNSMIRAHVAGRTKSWVFIHAGVVEWKGRAIIIPGQSHQGKTTLVSELIRAGAGYMSDEFAVLDADGLVHPFDRDLAVRSDPELGIENIPPGNFGGRRVTEPIVAGMVLFTAFVDGASWNPKRMTVGRGILESIPQVIPFSFNTEFALKVLNTTFNRAIITESDRGEARVEAPRILEYFDELLETKGVTLA